MNYLNKRVLLKQKDNFERYMKFTWQGGSHKSSINFQFFVIRLYVNTNVSEIKQP